MTAEQDTPSTREDLAQTAMEDTKTWRRDRSKPNRIVRNQDETLAAIGAHVDMGRSRQHGMTPTKSFREIAKLIDAWRSSEHHPAAGQELST